MLKAFEEVYDSYWYVLGNKVRENLEEEYETLTRRKSCVGVSNLV